GNVAGLVYIAAFAPEAGETLGAINARYPDTPLSAALRTFTYSDDRGEQATDTFVDAALFHDAVCAEAPADVADTLARTQRSAPSRERSGREAVRSAAADRRRRARCRLRRHRAARRPDGAAAARVALRHPQLRRRRARAGGGRIPCDRPVPAGVRPHAVLLR